VALQSPTYTYHEPWSRHNYGFWNRAHASHHRNMANTQLCRPSVAKGQCQSCNIRDNHPNGTFCRWQNLRSRESEVRCRSRWLDHGWRSGMFALCSHVTYLTCVGLRLSNFCVLISYNHQLSWASSLWCEPDDLCELCKSKQLPLVSIFILMASSTTLRVSQCTMLLWHSQSFPSVWRTWSFSPRERTNCSVGRWSGTSFCGVSFRRHSTSYNACRS